MPPPESHAPFLGTWTFPADEEFADTGLLHFAADGRAIQFVGHSDQPHRMIPMHLWYTVESDLHLRFRPHPDAEGWLREYQIQMDGKTLLISGHDRSWPCTRLDQVPPWFPSALAAALTPPQE